MNGGIKVRIGVNPASDAAVFRYGAADEILRVLVDAHEQEFATTELVETTGTTRATVSRALDLLDELGVLRIRETPQRKYVSIDPAVLEKDDPVLAIDQSEFHAPVRTFLRGVRDAVDDSDEVDDLVGVVVFGSVARGDADRRSDVDCLVVVEGDRTVARRLVADVASDLRERRFDGDRYDVEHYVESVESATRAGEKLREVFDDGITLHEGDELRDVRRAVMADE